MTVIAWDGRTLAADKRSTIAGYPATATKIHRVPGGLVGFTGSAIHAAELLHWFRNGRDPADFPKRDEETGCGALFITDDRRILLFTHHSGFPELIESPFFARGAGGDYALAAMHLGHDARTAVEVACALDTSCGNGIDTLELPR
jgi:ATP-dependent protease HslVU (ClpYQ) peptidase subunit